MHNALRQPTVLLAAMQSGAHIQVGPVREYNEAHDAFDALDCHNTGWTRDEDGRLVGGGKRHLHAIKGEPVKFYRLREVRQLIPETASPGCVTNVDAEFGEVERVRSTGVRRTGFVGVSK